jgi:hypothetical protein
MVGISSYIRFKKGFCLRIGKVKTNPIVGIDGVAENFTNFQ